MHQYPPYRVGGTELHTQRVSCGLAQLDHVVAVFCREDGIRCGVRLLRGGWGAYLAGMVRGVGIDSLGAVGRKAKRGKCE